MKLWHKIAAISASVAVVGGSAAAIIIPLTNKNNDDPGANPPPPAGPLTQEQATQVGTSLAGAIKGHLENAKTLTITMQQSNLNQSSSWDMEDESLEEDTYYYEMVRTLQATVTKTATSYNIKTENTEKYRYAADDEWETEETLIQYFIDGYVYDYDEDSNLYVKEEFENQLDTITSTLDLVFDGVTLTQPEENTLYQSFGSLFGKTFTVENNVATVAYDGKAVINDFKTYVNGIDPAAKTVEDVFDDVLKELNDKLTTEKVLSKIESFANKTLPQALEAIDTWIYDEYDTTLQEIVDKVTDDPRTTTIVTNAMLMKMGVDKQDIPTEIQTEIDETIASMKEFTVASLISEEMEEVTVYDFVVQTLNTYLSQLPSEDDQPMQIPAHVTLSDIMLNVNMFLNQTLNVALGEGMFDSIKASVNGITANELSWKNSLAFNSAFAITKINSEMKIDVAMNQTSQYDDSKTDTTAMKATQSLTIELFNTATPIALPLGAEIYVDPLEKFSEENYDNGNRKLAFDTVFLGGSEGYIYFVDYDYDLDEHILVEGDISGAEFTYEISEDGNTITCTITGLIRYYEGMGLSRDIEEISDWMNGDLTFELIYNESTGTWTTNLPETIPNQN